MDSSAAIFFHINKINVLPLRTPPFLAGCILFIFQQDILGMVVQLVINRLHARVKMQYDWIIDVLGDIKAFAKSNGLTALAEQLDDTSLIAAAEITRVTGTRTGGKALDGSTVGAIHRRVAASGKS